MSVEVFPPAVGLGTTLVATVEQTLAWAGLRAGVVTCVRVQRIENSH